MSRDQDFFNCSEKHEIEYLASKFEGPKEELVNAIKKLCKEGKIKYSKHADAEMELIKLGYKKK